MFVPGGEFSRNETFEPQSCSKNRGASVFAIIILIVMFDDDVRRAQLGQVDEHDEASSVAVTVMFNCIDGIA
jgi:hypothetical protein